MSRQFILIGKSRKTGKDTIISGREAEAVEQLERYKDLARENTHGEFENVMLLQAVPFKKNLYFDQKPKATAPPKTETK